MAFRVQARLGRGRVVDSFDAVLDVHGEKLDVVIKRVRPEFRTNDALQDALLEWGRAQAAVDHPDVVAILEAGRDQDGVYIIQERIEGATLARVLKTLRSSKRTLSHAYALLIGERAAAAVAGLQASPAGYHGDLDSGEVLLGYDGAVKVGDQRLLDLSSIVGLDLDLDGRQAPYRPPEGPGAGPAGDAYAVALAVLEMMLGHPVWRTSSMTVDDALRALVDFAPVAQVDVRLAHDLKSLLQPCLRQEVSQRQADLSALARDFTAMLDRHAVTRDTEGLGTFIELVSPPLDEADAPTRMAAIADFPDPIAGVSPDRRAAFEAASVVITPELLAQAEAEYQQRRAAEPSSPEATERIRSRSGARSGPSSGRATLQGHSVPVDVLTAPPSRLKAAAAELPNVAAKAAQAMSEAHGRPWWPYVAIALVVIGFGWLLWGGEQRTIQFQVTSEPSEASVFVNDVLVGQTPLNRPLDVGDEQIELRFEKRGFEVYRVTIGTEEDELRYEAPLKRLEGGE